MVGSAYNLEVSDLIITQKIFGIAPPPPTQATDYFQRELTAASKQV